MSRRQARLAAAVATLATACATACATDVTEPKPAADPASASLIFFSSYQASVLPLTYGAAMNASGTVVGRAGQQGVVYAAGVTSTLPIPAGFNSVTPVDVINDGRILAQGDGPQGPAALYYPSATSMPVNISAPRWAEPVAMNNQGVAVGRFGAPGRSWGAFRWTTAGGMVDITPPGFDLGWARDISEGGSIVGWVQLVNDVSSFRWNVGSNTGVVLPAGFGFSQALDGGSVLGWYPGVGSATWYPSGTISPTGPNPTVNKVDRISPNGRFIGHFTDPATGESRAWTSIGTGAPLTLPVPAGYLATWVTDVNACGTILGGGKLASDSSVHAIVWSRSFTCDQSPLVASAL